MIQTLTIDRTTLPPLFLPLAKSQSRIDHDKDDALVTEYVAQSIDDIERLTNATIWRRTIELLAVDLPPPLSPSACPPGSLGAWPRFALPFNNVEDFTATDAEGLDVSDAWRLVQTDPGGLGTSWLSGPTAPYPYPWPGVGFSFIVGMMTLATIAPALRRVILRRTAALYEFREAVLPLSADDLASEPLLWRVEL